MFVDATSTKDNCKHPDNEGLLKRERWSLHGFLSKRINISTILLLIFGGTLFAMAPLPAEEDEYRIRHEAIHSLFHRFQKTEGIDPHGFNTD